MFVRKFQWAMCAQTWWWALCKMCPEYTELHFLISGQPWKSICLWILLWHTLWNVQFAQNHCSLPAIHQIQLQRPLAFLKINDHGARACPFLVCAMLPSKPFARARILQLCAQASADVGTVEEIRKRCVHSVVVKQAQIYSVAANLPLSYWLKFASRNQVVWRR